MSKLYFLAVGVFSLFLLGCSMDSPEVLIDSFEGEINSKTVDFGSSENSSLKVEADNNLKVDGEQSIKLDYDLKPSGYMWAARGCGLDTTGADRWVIKPQDIDWSKYNAVSLYMYGSNSEGVIAFDIKDKGGEFWRFLLDDDFTGWKEIVCPLEHFFSRGDWQPEDAVRDEILDFPIMSFQFEPRMPGKGICHFDCIKFKKHK